jgi:hypothetical protein
MTAPMRAAAQAGVLAPPPLTVTVTVRADLDRLLPTVEDRRTALRQIAAERDDLEPWLVRILVGALADLHLTALARATGWEELVEATGDLAALGCGDLDPRDIAPHAQPGSRWTVATEVCEERITRALTALVGSAT